MQVAFQGSTIVSSSRAPRWMVLGSGLVFLMLLLPQRGQAQAQPSTTLANCVSLHGGTTRYVYPNATCESDEVYVQWNVQGPAGATGTQGPMGPQGLIGPQGPIGLQGPIGVQGQKGATGAQGPMGLQGQIGPQGPVGLQGPIGVPGQKGATGAQGPMGLQGPIGVPGQKGATGAQGPMGPQGQMGETGAAGPQGPSGPTGPQGPAGTNAPSYTIHYYDSILSIGGNDGNAGDYTPGGYAINCPAPEIPVAASCGYQLPAGAVTSDQHNIVVNYAGLGFGAYGSTAGVTGGYCQITNAADSNSRNVLVGVSCLATVPANSASVVKSCSYDPDTQLPCTAAEALPATESSPNVFTAAPGAAGSGTPRAAIATQSSGTHKTEKTVTLWFRE